MNRILKKEIIEWGILIVAGFVLHFFISNYVFQINDVPSGSMENTIKVGNHVFSLIWFDKKTIKRGDILTFYPPIPGNKKLFIKRVIGLPGDVVEVKQGAVYINNNKIEEPYIKEKPNYAFGPVTVPADEYLFFGDNRNESFDSHLWVTPFVQKQNIVGKALIRVWPFSRWGKF